MSRGKANILTAFTSGFSNKKKSQKYKPLLGYAPGLKHAGLYVQAFRHSSAANKSGTLSQSISNERLEFLGDAVLDLVVADMLFKRFAVKGEGFLTEMRSKIVSRDHLNFLAEKMGLVEYLDLDPGLDLPFHIRKSLAGNALESLLGAMYLDRGFQKTRTFILKKILKPYVDMDELENKNENYKSILYHHVQTRKETAVFQLTEESGKSHQRAFTIAVLINGEEIARGSGFTKKKAEQMAAMRACESLDLLTAKK